MDEDSGVAYQSYQFEMIRAFLFAQYYTNLDVSEMDDEEGHKKVYDYLLSNNIMTEAVDAFEELRDDILIVDSMYYHIMAAAKEVFDKKNSLSHKVMSSFASILTDESLTESLAKSQVVNEQMIDLIGAFVREKDAQGKVPPVRVGNNVVKLAKKK